MSFEKDYVLCTWPVSKQYLSAGYFKTTRETLLSTLWKQVVVLGSSSATGHGNADTRLLSEKFTFSQILRVSTSFLGNLATRILGK